MQRQIQVSGTWSGLVTLLAFSDSIEHEFKLSPDERYLMRLVVEEIASNIIKYGYSESHTGPIQLECRYHNDTLQLVIRDQGSPFDLREHPLPDLNHTSAAECAVGGLGVFFVRELVDQISYTHDPQSGWNELTVTKGRLP